MGKVEMMLLQLNDDLLRTKVSQQVLLHLRHEQHRMKAAESGKKKKKSGTERCQWHWPLVFLIVLYLSRTIYIFTLGCFVLLVLECNIQWFLM